MLKTLHRQSYFNIGCIRQTLRLQRIDVAAPSYGANAGISAAQAPLEISVAPYMNSKISNGARRCGYRYDRRRSLLCPALCKQRAGLCPWCCIYSYLMKTRTAARMKNRAAVDNLTKPKCFCINLENAPEVAPNKPSIKTITSGAIKAML